MILQGTAARTQQRMTLEVKSPISNSKAEYEGCATWSIPRGVSSHHVLLWAFGDAYFRREKVRHATLLFCAKSVNVQGNGAGGKEDNMDIETKPDKKVDVADVTTVSLRDMYMRLCACRDFEIKLQWERAVFLTAFLIACFAGYGSFMLSVHQHGYGSLSSLLVKCIPIAITFVGIVLSLFWILMAKGSKAWYEHYEQAIAAFAKEHTPAGVFEYMLAHQWYSLSDIKRNPMSNGILNFKGGCYSVSKIVIAIGVGSLIIWSMLFVLHSCSVIFGPISRWFFSGWNHWIKVAVFIILIVVAFAVVHHFLTKRVGSSYLKILKMFLPVEKSYAKIDAWIRQNDDVESWVKKQEIHAKRYVLIEEEKITVYIIDNGKVAETYELQRNLCMSFLKDKELGLYSLD